MAENNCNDTRECYLRDRNGCCRALASTYPDGECPFCKEHAGIVNGLEGQREPEEAEPAAVVEKSPVINEVLESIREKLKFVANENGSGWRMYADLLTRCENVINDMVEENAALHELIKKLRKKLEWKPVSENLPLDNTLLIATVIVDGMPEIRSGLYLADEGYLLDGIADNLEALAWIETPDPWEGAYEIKSDSEPDEAE